MSVATLSMRGSTSPDDARSFVPKAACDNPPILDPVDPVSREVTFVPSKTPYDPRHMLAGRASKGIAGIESQGQNEY